MKERYYSELAAAAARGAARRAAGIREGDGDGARRLQAAMLRGELPEVICAMSAEERERLLLAPLCELSQSELLRLTELCEPQGVRLHYFKRSERVLPRIHKALGFLRGTSVENILDVGSGRGAFLFPLLSEFPHISAHAVDLLERRYRLLDDLRAGGVDRLYASLGDICRMPLADKSYDAVTMLEVLEHIPDIRAAASAAVRLARKFVILTVPSEEDDNPEHIHLFTEDKLRSLFLDAGAVSVRFERVPGHIFAVASV